MSGTPGGLLDLLTLGTALGCGLMGGVFFAFSTFVMPALARLPAAQGIAAMQSINVAAITPSFMGPLFGTAAACALLAACAISTWPRTAAVLVVAGSLLYLAGTLLVTMVFNVPRNAALAAVDPLGAEAANLWAGYVSGWTAWNHVRAAAAIAAAGLFTIALLR